MSQKKTHHILSRAEVLLLERKITTEIAKSLRHQFRNSSTAVKDVTEETGAVLATVKKWYEGQNPPSLGHFVILCRHYDSILKAFLKLSGNGYLIAFIQPKGGNNLMSNGSEQGVTMGEIDSENVTINVTIKSLNERQRWFFDRVCHRITPTIEEFMDRWDATQRTARRDIAALVQLGLIRRVGAKKNGSYEGVK